MPTKRLPISLIQMPQTLAALLTAAGLPRAVQDDLLHTGQISVNSARARHLQQMVDLLVERVQVAGAPLAGLELCRYVLVYKPYRVLCSFTDHEGRATLGDYVPVPDVYAVGRLDYDSEGLMLLTDDGWLNHRLAHPRYDHPKTYLVQVERIPDDAALRQLARGVLVKGERTLPAEVELLASEPELPERSAPVRYRASVPTAWLRVVLREGKKRQIRHMTAAVGYPTLRLVRVALGPLELGALQPGEWRVLTPEELLALRASVGYASARRR